jgi:hypothetical protein
LTLRKVMPVTVLAIAGLLSAAGCGGTLEGKYRRGELTTTTTRTTPTSGNAAGQRAEGAAGRPATGGTIVESAAWRSVVPPLGGRHR